MSMIKPVYRYVPDFEQAMQYPWSLISGKFVWFGERQSKFKKVDCRACKGSGEIVVKNLFYHTVECEACRGTGKARERIE